MNLNFYKNSKWLVARVTVACLSLAAAHDAFGRGPKLNPVQWSLSSGSNAVAPGSSALLHLRAEIAPGYHLYSLTTPAGGPIQTTLALSQSPAIEAVRIYQPAPNRHVDPNLNVPVETFSNTTDFLLEARIKPDAAVGSTPLLAQVRYQACSDEICLPPVERTASATLDIQKGIAVTKAKIPAGYRLVNGSSGESKNAALQTVSTPLDLRFLLLAFGFGLAAVFTPCVFPTVPLTISYFLNGPGRERRSAVKQALLFSAGIVVLFSAIGVLVTVIAGPFGVVQLASSPWVNGVIAIVFFSLGLSLLGAFELALPSGLLTKLDGASQQGGIVGGLLLGLTFCLTSFACVGPFLGTLLAGSVQGSGLQPVLGMVAFASGLATPFFLLSMFPALLKKLPKSGGWLARVKIVFGFVILAMAFKYLAGVDAVLQLHLLTRDRFIALWFALFLVAAFYLFGLVKIGHEEEKPQIGLSRLLSGAALLAFAVSLLPALWGGSLGELESFVPAAEMRSAAAASSPVWLKNDYQGALAQARREHKPLLVSFAGYACTNCHWMKANILPRPEIAEALKNYVLVELYTDGTDSDSAKNQMLEQDRFSTIALPYYAVLNADEKELAHQAGLTRKAGQFLSFLNTGLRGGQAADVT